MLVQDGSVREVKNKDVARKIPFDRRSTTCHDKFGNNVNFDMGVKVVNGSHSGSTGIVKRIYKNFVFLWNKEFRATNCYFVERARDIVLQGHENMKKSHTGVSNVSGRDELRGKEVIIIKGDWKGHRGIAISSDETKVMIELMTKCRKLPIDRQHVRLVDDINKEDQT